MELDAIIVAGGSASRFGADKLAVSLAGLPVLAWSIRACATASSVRSVIVVANVTTRTGVEALAREHAGSKFLGVVPGGVRRRDSVEAGIRATKSRYVAIHDGARPLITPALIDSVAAAADGLPGAIPGIPVTDTIKAVAAGRIVDHLDRAALRAAQTPQVVLRQAWLDAAAASDDDETDDAAMLARFGLEIAVVAGDPENLKVTRPADLEIATAILRKREGRA